MSGTGGKYLPAMTVKQAVIDTICDKYLLPEQKAGLIIDLIELACERRYVAARVIEISDMEASL